MMNDQQTKQDIIKYPVAEYFISINGEGRLAGYLAAFIRMRGCNLHCSYCDTRWACTPDCPVTLLSAEEILAKLRQDHASRATLTGGEPLMTKGIGQLTDLLGSEGIAVEVETNGSIPVLPFCERDYRPRFTLDYKCPGSGMEDAMITDNFRHLSGDDCVKFVVSDRDDLDKAREITQTWELDRRCSVFLSPVFGRITPEEIVAYMKDHSWYTARLQLQLHKYIWPPQMRGV